ncbi:MAG: hypothetical protein M3066_09150 [Actinomycetota bacterium]|nr:hypothetical protein [Actinomycetota bacterium]
MLAGCASGDGVPEASPQPTTTTTAPAAAEVTVRGVVAGVSGSARVVQLSPPVSGYSNLALTTDTQIVRANGAPATLGDVTAGATIEAVGRATDAQSIVARKLTLL